MSEPTKENKVIDTYSLYPDRKSWVEKQAVALTAKEGRRVSKSEIVDRLISEAMQEDRQMAAKVIRRMEVLQERKNRKQGVTS